MNQEGQSAIAGERLKIPVRAIGISRETGEFTEETYTVLVNQAGAHIALAHRVDPGDIIRIINLENYSEADFRVVGPTRLSAGRAGVWGVECVERERNIWGIELAPSPQAKAAENGLTLECRGCHQKGLVAVTLMEAEVLGLTGQIVRECVDCGKPTYWMYAEVARRPREIPASEPVTPPAKEAAKKRSEQRVHKRLAMKLPILVRNQKNEQEIARTENVSKGGVAVGLAMELAVGDKLTVICPYEPAGQSIEQKAEVRWRSPFPFGGTRTYGLAYVR